MAIRKQQKVSKNNPDTVRAYFLKNKKKIYADQKKWKQQNPDKIRQYRANYHKKHPIKVEEKNFRTKVFFLKKVNLTFKEFKKMLRAQKNRCAICGKKESLIHQSGTPRLLCIDHNHETMKVRGLLCQRCNSALGFFNDSIEMLEKAVKYLKMYD